MRRVFNGFARGLVVVSVVAALAVPAEARPQNENEQEGRWFRDPVAKIVQVVKKLVARTCGDGLTDPKP